LTIITLTNNLRFDDMYSYNSHDKICMYSSFYDHAEYVKLHMILNDKNKLEYYVSNNIGHQNQLKWQLYIFRLYIKNNLLGNIVTLNLINKQKTCDKTSKEEKRKKKKKKCEIFSNQSIWFAKKITSIGRSNTLLLWFS
jgi:hypothetical protein